MMRCLFISMCLFSHQTFPSPRPSPKGASFFALLQSAQCLTFLPPAAMKQGICLLFPICKLRWPHQTVPGETFDPPGRVSCPCLHVPHMSVMMSSSFPYPGSFAAWTSILNSAPPLTLATVRLPPMCFSTMVFDM